MSPSGLAGPLPAYNVTLEDGESKTIFVRNLPTQIKAHFAELNRVSARMRLLDAVIASREPGIKRADAVAPTYASGSAEYVNAAMAQRAQVELAKISLEDAKAELESLNVQYSTLSQKSPSDLAMFTGAKYAQKEIWDCGLKKQ